MKSLLRTATFALAIAACLSSHVSAQQLTESNYDQLVPAGKEVDAIYGDYAIHNKAATAIVAFPTATRNANMTVRNIGGCLIDLAASSHESDQLSSFFPGRRKFVFTDGKIEDQTITVTAAGTDKTPNCVVTYVFASDLPVIEVTSTWTNTTKQDWTLPLEDDLRADGGKEDMIKSPNGTHDLFYFHDIYWQQAYGFLAPGYKIRSNSNSRECVLNYESADGKSPILKPGDSFTLQRQIIVGKDLPSVLATADRLTGVELQDVKLRISDANNTSIASARIEINSDGGSRGTSITNKDGSVKAELPIGQYTINATVAGTALLPKDAVRISIVAGSNVIDFASGDYSAGTVSANVTDGDGQPIPAKVEFIGSGKTASPNWGPETAEHFVKNLAYTANGKFETPLAAGTYDIIISHGPEYDAVFTKLNVEAGKTAELKASLKHSVQTPGWVSSDFHSHSSPSGDNTGSQKGRVLNLAAENVEFAPCTEHNRVSTYDGHIAELGLKPFLATVSGMELTGSPLLLNHQNVFPMKHTPRTQDGGGPVTDGSPETQIERISLWDDRSEKLIQQNHPDLGWLFYDKNGDGEPDEGYSRSFGLMDVMEIHPIDRILKLSQFDDRAGKPFGNNRMLNWLQLLNQGFRIYGVVNTDAHYNFHGSGWLRNWIQSSTDEPAKIDFMEMVHASEQGRLIMSNGPYLESTFTASDSKASVVSGQDLLAKSGKVDIHVRVQCANWLDVDTVFVMVNGKISDELRFTRTDNPEMFSNDVVKFDQQLSVTLTEDSHLIVVTGHQTTPLGDVAGPQGSQLPAALTNPVFVDIDDNGFQSNKDTLGFPLPVKFVAPK
ncbi:MAG: CehA/McbA family metallohydrolase [Fuerstiella sp.]